MPSPNISEYLALRARPEYFIRQGRWGRAWRRGDDDFAILDFETLNLLRLARSIGVGVCALSPVELPNALHVNRRQRFAFDI